MPVRLTSLISLHPGTFFKGYNFNIYEHKYFSIRADSLAGSQTTCISTDKSEMNIISSGPNNFITLNFPSSTCI